MLDGDGRNRCPCMANLDMPEIYIIHEACMEAYVFQNMTPISGTVLLYNMTSSGTCHNFFSVGFIQKYFCMSPNEIGAK